MVFIANPVFWRDEDAQPCLGQETFKPWVTRLDKTCFKRSVYNVHRSGFVAEHKLI